MAFTLNDGRLVVALYAHRESDPDNEPWYNRLIEMIDKRPTVATGTFRRWCQAHDGAQADTLQLTTANGRVWGPMARFIDASSHATSVNFDGSYRDYAGCKVLGADADSIVISAEQGAVIIVYRLTGK